MFLFLEGKAREDLPPLKDIRTRCIDQLELMRPDHMRRLNPTPYKVLLTYLCITAVFISRFGCNYLYVSFDAKQVSVSAKLYDFIHFLWLNEAPVGELQ